MFDIIPPSVAWWIIVSMNILCLFMYLVRIAIHDWYIRKVPAKHKSLPVCVLAIVVLVVSWLLYMPLKP